MLTLLIVIVILTNDLITLSLETSLLARIMEWTNFDEHKVKECLQEIVNKDLHNIVHELRKKVVILETKLQEQQDKISESIRNVEKINKCHECHKIIVEHRDASTQTTAHDTGL